MDAKTIPLSVKIISIAYPIYHILFLLIGFWLILRVFNFDDTNLFDTIKFFPIPIILFTGFLIFLGIFFWKGKKWARIVLIIILSISIISDSAVIIMGYKNISLWIIIELLTLIVDSVILTYLLFNKKVKNYFGVNKSNLRQNSRLKK